MDARVDPEENEIHALSTLIGPLTPEQVLEIGCGDGRLTWRYAGLSKAHITAIDPDPDLIQKALSACPTTLRTRVEFHNLNLEQYAAQVHSARFDLAILAWSL